ncbi:nucleosidase [Jiangella alkaliphila]|uniref:Adenosylhomocysteine nucleosidase n=1 Tax=Jiangella alkaliphila TaxID=419479 RepID=A0A1H2L2G2_9ACTN|nr:nucleosidase [Jiangella alkaliphila]SDU74726.1 adenosylhomocysteine nucleosidase [Jiangella alkaliphila]
MTSYLIVSATEAEARYVPAGLPVVITGIGKTAAATATTQALAGRAPDDLVVVNIGTAGALRPGLTGLFTPRRVLNHDLDADLVRALGLDPEELIELPVGDGVTLATGDRFVADSRLRDELAQRADLVDMEGYAVAYACRRLGVPVRLVKHVSDAADESAMDWPTVVDASARVLGAWLGTELAD